MMNKLRLFTVILILFSLTIFDLAAQNPSNISSDSFEETAGTGLVINTNPSNVTVFIDGVERGKTPFTLNNLTQGVYHIRLTKDGYKDRSFNATIYNTSRLIVSIKMEENRGSALISVFKSPGSPSDPYPFNPIVFVSDNTQSIPVHQTNNATLVHLPVGHHFVRARAFGWEDVSEIISITDNSTVITNIYMKPAVFKTVNLTQSRKRFNPQNSNNLGSNEFRFEVTAPGRGTITITNNSEEIVYSAATDIFASTIQTITWNGRNSNGEILPQGVYTVKINSSSVSHNGQTQENSTLEIQTEINYSTNIYPLSTESGISGLTFAPMPQTLASGSYQFNASLIFGSFSLPVTSTAESKEINSLAMPISFNMRVTPVNKLELFTGLNINPYFKNDNHSGNTGWGVSGSVKYNFLNLDIFSLTAGAFYSWTDEYGDFPLSPGRGVGSHIPASLNLKNFSIIFCPSVFWYGPAGLVPSLFLSAGAIYFGNIFNAGLSARCEMDFSEEPLKTKFLAGAEIYIFPPPSNIFFSFNAGVIHQEQHTGGYGGFKIGIIN